MLKAIIFDMDNTLVRSEHLHLKAFKETLKEYGVEIQEDFLDKYGGMGSTAVFTNVFKENNIDADIKEAKAKKYENYFKYLANPGVEKIKGLDKFLEKLKKTDLKLAVGSGSGISNIEKTTKQTEIYNYFDILKSGNQVPYPKPAPDLFLQIAEELGVTPEECLVIEDSNNGIQAAKSAKMKVVGIATTYPKQELEKMDLDMIIENYLNLEISDFEALFN